ncbi:cardiolipin synthase [Desertibacillus haloalkaliphilus]|uniref:cardiolipin synthase n=1 Tax=Desertibacillus haloalkaliphilus TaxID=1328930 RepID=UPI001C277ADF|nr:cardiolipin synthase [Desertibacillus haloalkaliphilus]MBU8907962.1 cardiolipin synthase [Desertibacillus haloalkaliphilus]
MDILTIFLAILFLLNFVFASIIIFIERKDATSTWAWLMVLYFIPLAGFIFYLIFGQNYSRKRLFDWDDIQKIGIESQISEQMNSIRDPNFTFKDPNVDEYRDLIFMQLTNNGAVLSKENDIDIFIDGNEKFDTLLEDIENAEDHIHLQSYIMRNDNLGQKIISALVKKAKEGVKVRVLYDDMGSRKLSRKDFRQLMDAGGEVGVFFPSAIPYINLRLNFRNHRKLIIIDGHMGYIGGFNIGDEYLGLNEKFGYWRDTHLRIKGPAIDTMQTRFILDWNQASKSNYIKYERRYFPTKKIRGDAAVQVVSSGPDSEWEQVKNGYLKMIASAKESIYIQTPYFIPDASILDTLRVAALSGKDVRIMIPNKPDHMFVYWATFSYIGELLKTGAKVYIYDNGFIHAKTIVVDGKISSVGTANIDMRSFKLNFEVNAFIYHKPTSRRLKQIFQNDMERSTEVTLRSYQHRPRRIRFKESISRLLSPIL